MTAHEEIDFSSLDFASTPPPTPAEFRRGTAEEVGLEVDRMKNIVERIDKGGEVHPSLLVTFGDNNTPRDYAVSYQAMTWLLESYQVADIYFNPVEHPGEYEFTLGEDNGNDWDLNIARPDGRGTFRILYRHDVRPVEKKTDVDDVDTTQDEPKPIRKPGPVSRHTIFYKRGVTHYKTSESDLADVAD